MARLDVHPMLGEGEGCVLDVQADLLSHPSTRTVLPLLPETAAPRPISELNPIFEIGGKRHVLVTQAIASIRGCELKPAVSSLAGQHDSIARALDILLLGSRPDRVGVKPLAGNVIALDNPIARNSVQNCQWARTDAWTGEMSCKGCGHEGRAAMNVPLLVLSGIEKRYGGVRALRGVDFDLNAGEVHVLLGENGAGKSTLMSVISGAISPDAGSITLAGETRHFSAPREAHAAGIVMIPQELDLVPGLDIASNLFLGHERLTTRRTLDGPRMMREAHDLLSRAGVSLDPAHKVSSLRMGERQLVAIAKALAADARILILDEPTAALSATEAEHLFMVVLELRARGVGIVYISHRLEEVARIADRVTVMRDGAVAGHAAPDAPQAELVRLLVGRDFSELFPAGTSGAGTELLSLSHARFLPAVPRAGWQAPVDVSLTVHAGEIVGLSGLMGAGRTELLSALFGYEARGRWDGDIRIGGKPARLGSVSDARRAGIAYVTDDRRGTGLVLNHTVAWNIVMSTLKRVTPGGLVAPATEQAQVVRALDRFDVRPRLPGARVVNLSGGNQQKVVFAKELLSEPRLLLLDEPTRGVDVGAKAEIYRQLRELAGAGLGVLVASSELPELLGLCDRIVVMQAGVTVASFAAGVSEEELRRTSIGEVQAA